MKHILFVDDEPNVLSGLRRMMRPMKHEWDMDFADCGENALQLMGAKAYDAIVSDMRMPGMNGAQLLRRVMRDYPNTVRIAFSGHAEKELMLDCAETAHQYLAKPCDADQVRQTINRACELRRLLDNDDLQQLVSGLSTVPSLPELYVEIVEMIKSPDVSVKEVGDTIARDIGMTAKILQLVNSAFFGLRRHVATPGDAATLLGMEVVQGLVLTTKVFNELDQVADSGLDVTRIWQLSTETGALARQISAMEIQDAKTKDYALMAGLLHAVGRLVLAVNRPQDYLEATALLDDGNMEMWQAEQAVFGHSHMDVGAYLLGLWGLVDPIVEAVAYYQYPQCSHGAGFWPITAVHAASALLRGEHEAGNQTRFLDTEYLTKAGVADHVEHWQELLGQMRNAGEKE